MRAGKQKRKDACALQQINYNIKRTNLYESVAEHIEEMILHDASQVGQKLPSEQTLAANFGVSRNVIRESLKILKERQLISVQVGEGAYIKKPDDQSMTDMLNRVVMMDSIDPIKIYEMRSILEVNACRLAAANVNARDDIDRLEKINEQMRLYKDDIDKRIELDMEFHSVITHMSGNPLLELFERSIEKLVSPVIRTALLPSSGSEDGIRDHQIMIDVLRDGDSERAAELMSEHLRKSTQNYLDGQNIQGR